MVPSEETVVEIRERYSELNAHAQSYTFKALVTVPQPGSDKAEMQFQVPSEKTVVEIRERYSELNAHAQSYTFKALVTVPQPGSDKAEMQFQELDMNKTLLENGVPDETSTFEQLMIPTDAFALVWDKRAVVPV
ncbi:cytochrome b5 heme-binding domain-containing protein [Haematococcus lacustris]|uniref:Cytochrome b5 heme-binding domain-containing protein n=1 Tax=Haematococcus lacustris TaxID=44745 RepID=A0A6A0A630_HAELA|nr:cytochrome b5 heme-binding domain-containing protein [Haematococcus lacustris]